VLVVRVLNTIPGNGARPTVVHLEVVGGSSGGVIVTLTVWNPYAGPGRALLAICGAVGPHETLLITCQLKSERARRGRAAAGAGKAGSAPAACCVWPAGRDPPP
jgi:hypothetical protein